MIENNTSLYIKTVKIYADIIKEKKIKMIKWLVNSSNLYLIKNIWDCKKDFIALKLRKFKEFSKNI